MCVGYLGIALLAWLPGILHAQTEQQPCSPPELADGYVVPRKETYTHGETLSYGCETGFQPVAESWWATSTCWNGKWSHTPQCIKTKSCFPPTIPNGKYEKSQNGWYEERHIIEVTCEEGFDLKRRTRRAQCSNGRWSPLPICERNYDACDEPNKIPHGVIISQESKEVYAHTSQLKYECEDGYEANNTKVISCQGTIWIPEPLCVPEAPRCVLDPTDLGIGQTLHIGLKEGETKHFDCVDYRDYWRSVRCSNSRIYITECCHLLTIKSNNKDCPLASTISDRR